MGQGHPKWFSMPLLFLAVLVTASGKLDTGLDSFDGFNNPPSACTTCVDVVPVHQPGPVHHLCWERPCSSWASPSSTRMPS